MATSSVCPPGVVNTFARISPKGNALTAQIRFSKNDLQNKTGVPASEIDGADVFYPDPASGNSDWAKMGMVPSTGAVDPKADGAFYWTDNAIPSEDNQALQDQGVAFDLRLKDGSNLWLQEPGDNTPLS